MMLALSQFAYLLFNIGKTCFLIHLSIGKAHKLRYIFIGKA